MLSIVLVIYLRFLKRKNQRHNNGSQEIGSILRPSAFRGILIRTSIYSVVDEVSSIHAYPYRHETIGNAGYTLPLCSDPSVPHRQVLKRRRPCNGSIKNKNKNITNDNHCPGETNCPW